MKITNNHYLRYYCKNGICVIVSHYLPYFVNIPDEKGNIKWYISKAYTYDNLKLGEYETVKYDGNNDYLSYKCCSNSQCLTNKCIDGVCI